MRTMPLKTPDFNEEWYNNLISKSDEKNLLVDKFKEVLAAGKFYSCLEIGLGTTTHFSDALAGLFKKYTIVEKEKITTSLQKNVNLLTADWETLILPLKYDVILASHVIYYFKDKQAAVKKMFDSLNPGGWIIFVVNGNDADYGPLKLKFAELVNEEYVFTYDALKSILAGKTISEFSAPSKINFNHPSDLFNTLKLSFDLYPEEYVALKDAVCLYFNTQFRNKTQFVINQKIIVCKNDPWEQLIKHADYELSINGTKLLVKDGVFTPDSTITHSTTQLLKNLPNVQNNLVLDLGCGTGIIGISCLKKGAKRVVFSDNSKLAIDNTLLNLKNNKLEASAKVIQSDLFNNITETFDFIFANLPILDEVWDLKDKTQNITANFLKNCSKFVKPSGKVFLAWASFSDITPIKQCLATLGYDYDIIEETTLGYTWYWFVISF